MKRIIKIVMLFVFVALLPVNSVFADDNNQLEEKLTEIGLPDEYSNNIAQYIDNIDITEEEYSSILGDGKVVIELVYGKSNLRDFSISELYTVYSKISEIVTDLNLSMKVDFINKQVAILDKENDNILFKGSPNDINKYYSNYEELAYAGEEDMDLESYIKNLIVSEESNIVKEDKVNENYSEDKTIVLQSDLETEEIKANEEIGTDGESISSPIEKSIKNYEESTEKVNRFEAQYDSNLVVSKEVSNRTILYILGAAIIVLIVASGVYKLV